MKILIMILVCMFLFFIAACSDNDPEKDTGPPDASVIDMIEAQEATVDVEVIDDTNKETKDSESD